MFLTMTSQDSVYNSLYLTNYAKLNLVDPKLVDKDLFLGLGWLLREDKVSVEEVEGLRWESLLCCC